MVKAIFQKQGLLKPELENRVNSQNKSPIRDNNFVKPIHISNSFIKAGSNTTSTVSKSIDRNILSTANDWKLLVDFDHDHIVFPPEILSTDQRPDIIIWSRKTKMVLLIELTVPADENIQAAQIRKKARYDELSREINSVSSWNTKIITIEVGARGFVGKSMNSCLRKLGSTAHSSSCICKRISLVVARCSHHIWANRDNKKWNMRPLLEPYTHTDDHSGTDEETT